MTALQQVNLGTAPTGQDGDTTRVANVKANSNIAVLNAQATLTSAPATIAVASALTAGTHLGKRVNIALTVAGTVQMPTAASCGVDGIIHLRNTGTTIATIGVTAGSGDTVALSKLNPGETATMDADGAHAWSVLMRGRTNSDNEIVNGSLTVLGASTFGSTGQATVSAAGAYSGPSASYTGSVSAGTLGVTGAATFTVRPTFNNNTPWDSGNLASPATLVGAYTLTGQSSVTIPLSATYLEHELSIIGMATSATGNVYVQFSADGGATWVTAAGYYYGFNQLVLGATAPAVGSATGQSNSLITGGMGVGTITGSNRLDGRLTLYGMGLSSTNKQGKISTVAYLSDNMPRTVDGILGFVTAASPLTFNAMKVYVGSGTFTGGTIKLYGKP